MKILNIVRATRSNTREQVDVPWIIHAEQISGYGISIERLARIVAEDLKELFRYSIQAGDLTVDYLMKDIKYTGHGFRLEYDGESFIWTEQTVNIPG